MDRLVAIAFTCLGTFLTAGLIFASIQRRQTGESYILFWRNPLSDRARRFLSYGFFRGPLTEIVRILFFGVFTLIAALGIFQDIF